ncbi:alcohol dehydrogenase [Fusarium tjaetaba]|uniref:Alcohol dehydrogenase n=1 Tax=Fusarium tjaetaba TaxID=1567544 RepID=A0A8H5RSH8_9HYPO|nr:alcohol dehydrogenase [Fusarium tjaetaba]KAF5637326.1 alcohol dehydrogenase [Fusarium tjaetaba]
MSKCFQFVYEDKGAIDPVTLTSNDGPRVNRVGLSQKQILDAVDQSVERLGTCIDVLQIHRMDRDVPAEKETDAREQKDPFLKLLFRGGDQDTDRAIVERVEELAQKKGVAMAQIAQSWLIAKGCMPICGLESEERIDQAVGALQ